MTPNGSLPVPSQKAHSTSAQLASTFGMARRGRSFPLTGTFCAISYLLTEGYVYSLGSHHALARADHARKPEFIRQGSARTLAGRAGLGHTCDTDNPFSRANRAGETAGEPEAIAMNTFASAVATLDIGLFKPNGSLSTAGGALADADYGICTRPITKATLKHRIPGFSGYLFHCLPSHLNLLLPYHPANEMLLRR